MDEFFANPYFLIALTFGVYLFASRLRRRFGLSLMNPILISVILLVAFLSTSGVSYESYCEGGKYIEFWLKPAVVALGVPLYRQLSTIRKQLMPLLVAELAGCVAGLVSVVAIAELFGATREVIMSLAPKAVTTPIAMEISTALGGNPSLTAAVVVCTGIFGSMAGFSMVRMSRIRSSMAGSLSIGTASHAVGTAAAMERGGERFGAFSSLGLTLNGLFTALLAPVILPLLGY
ncbi:MAG: LrgB family protein [Muribaculaceae bacterium]|nr:LrgB family protein [Muribaculaceae bacterium]